MKNLKISVQRTVLLVGIALLIGKFVAYWLTDSVGILTDALESIVNVLAGMLGLWSVWLSS
ncbi:MAG: cation transporter, partial [Mucinivorans sp.]